MSKLDFIKTPKVRPLFKVIYWKEIKFEWNGLWI